MNELEKAYEEIKHWYCCAEQEGMTYEGEIIYLDYIKKHINNLQSKIDKAIEFVESMEYCGQEDYFYDNKSKDPCGNDNTFNDSKNKLLDILKEDK